MTTSQFIRSALLIFLIPVMAMAIEEPDYKVVGEYDNFELRLYAPYIIAEVDVQGEFDESGNNAFRILAGYIFGDNSASEKMAMTAPVASTREEKGEKMAMTAPVTSTAASENDRTTYAFVMERKYTLQTLPVPNDDRIRIRSMPERTIAVHRYSGRWTEEQIPGSTKRCCAQRLTHRVSRPLVTPSSRATTLRSACPSCVAMKS